MATAQMLLDAVRKEKTLDSGLATLISKLKAKVDAANGDQVLIDQAFAELSDNQAVTEAILANTENDPVTNV